MKQGIHPDYREVVFQDMSNGFKFITRSTIQTRETIELEGKTYPLAKIEVSSESHSLHRPAEDHGHGRPRREVQEQVRRTRQRQGSEVNSHRLR